MILIFCEHFKTELLKNTQTIIFTVMFITLVKPLLILRVVFKKKVI